MIRQWTVDAFAAAPFRGNPACVVEPLHDWPSDDWMRALAAENNQAETAFLLKTNRSDYFKLRWMTPTSEVPLCGHATMAAAHVLFSELGIVAETLTFETLSGPLSVRRTDGRYDMDFPAHPPKRIDPPTDLAAAIGIEPVETWASRYLVALLPSEAAVRALRPNIAAIEPICAKVTGGRGDLIVAALSDAASDYDVVSRFFAPSVGVSEDPATGSAHCILAPLYTAKLGRAHLRFHQAYPGRGGDIETELHGDRVQLRGNAITVIESVLRLTARE